MDFGEGKDKLTIDGTLVLEGNDPNIVAGLENIAGKGIIAADNAHFTDVSNSLINSFDGTLMNLGNTSKGFRGTEFEKADDTKSGAVEWDGIAAYDGWLGTGENIDCNDAVDFISLVVEEEGSKLKIEFNNWDADDVLKIAGSSQTVTDNKIEYELLKVGTYIIEINRKAEDSMSYTMTIA